ncbi:WYL domain-containing protein [Aminipila terrae]|uniref:WYL domain-containing protein n=1 Tax=Aminipila terrae TaxID=2697030 RepID=A0A6P1MGB3_9FIRM|nr:WYL domain-containing protein [Aminipila terrae]QHI73092.1 WYL domain-containing protein [Aminipila terrae]
MLFSEIYSAYYNAVAHLISKAIDGDLNEKTASDLIRDSAFSESFVYILNAIKNEEWQVINKELKTPIKHKPSMPLTTLQLSFLKAISLDARFALFSEGIKGLEGIAPLYVDKDFYYTDIIKDGDPYESDEYRKNFKTVLQALTDKRKLLVSFKSGKGHTHKNTYVPRKLEYSQKDDKFRLICKGNYKMVVINLARITNCQLGEHFEEAAIKPYNRKKSSVVLEIIDERNALERSMLHFANFEKETKQIEKDIYQMKIIYNGEDETEVLIRVLSFGPMLKVLEPKAFTDQIKQRLSNQEKLRVL